MDPDKQLHDPPASNADLDTKNAQDGAGKRNQPVRYKVEYIHPTTNEVVSSRTTTRLGEENGDAEDEHDPVFEVVTTYQSRTTERSKGEQYDDNDDDAPPRKSFKAPTYRLDIYSPALRHALRSVVKYYPSQDLSGDVIGVDWPYTVLVHHYTELTEFGGLCDAKKAGDLCVREKDANDHINLLLGFLDENIMDKVRTEQQRNQKGFVTWEYYWVPYKPGIFGCGQLLAEQEHKSYVVKSLSGGVFDNPRTDWRIDYWTLGFDGQCTQRVSGFMTEASFDGETKLDDILEEDQMSEDSIDSLSEVVKERLKYGQRYWDLVRKQCQYYKGKSEGFPSNEVEGLVMTDLKAFYAEFPGENPAEMDQSDLRHWTSDCLCLVCMTEKENTAQKVQVQFHSYIEATLEDNPKLTPQQYFLLPNCIEAFVFGRRGWESLHVKGFSQPQFQENMIENLVMNQQRKETLIALASSFARLSRKGEKLADEMWSADFVRGKGSGLTFLLHGQPGVGKTYTAECIAAYARRPLMTLTASDIGVNPDEIQERLTDQFRTAKSWGVVLLIDEADVFMERRTSSNLVRNSLVAGFLRALEYYDGILFLTTNRVGIFDDAFISRIHIQLYYKPFGEDERRKVWQTFVKKLSDDRGKYIRLNAEAKEYIYGKEVCTMKWNGREIRNAFQTAVALAEYDSKKDEEGTILVTYEHFQPVMALSQDFATYLDTLHIHSQEKRAEVRYERLDTFEGT